MNSTHSKMIGYILWIFGFTGSHRFYFGKRITGAIWLVTFGLLGIGWLVDLFLIPSMEKSADRRFKAGPHSYDAPWLCLTFVGVLGIHRMLLGKWITGILYFLTGGLLFVGVVYDFLTLNDQISELNGRASGG